MFKINELCNKPVKYSRFFQNISEINVGVQKVGVKCDSLLKVVDSEPDLALGIEHASEVGPGHGKVRPGLYSFQITCLRGRGRNKIRCEK